jgi:PAS domain S-box-containing protein
MKLRSHLLLLVLGAILPVLVFSGLMVVLFARQERLAAERGLVDTARALAVAVDREIETSLFTLQALAASETLDGDDLPRFRSVLKRALPTQRGWRSIFLADMTGRQLLDTAGRPGQALPAIGDREYFRAVLATGRPQVSDLLESRVTGAPAVTVAVPVRRDGRSPWVLGATLDLERLTELLARQQLPGDWTGAILDRRSTIIARSRTPERFIGQPATPALAARSRQAEEGTFWDETKEGSPAFGAFSRVRIAGWTVVLGVPAAAVQATVHGPVLTLAAGGLAFLLLGTGLAVVLGRRIARSLGAVATSAGALGRGEPVAVTPGPVAEVNEVAGALALADRERARAEAARRESEGRYRLLFESSPHPAWVFDVQTLEFLAVNEAACRLYGYSREEFLAMSSAAIRTPEEAERLRRFLAEAPPDAVDAGEWHHRRKDGTTIAVEITSTALAFAGRRARLAQVTDVTARRRGEREREDLLRREREARAEAETANRTKDEFLATLSHELRTPLGAVLGWARMLRTTPPSAETLARALEVIERNARAQAQLIDDILDVSRITAGKLRLDVRPVDLGAVITAALDTVRPAVEARQIRLQTTLDPRAGPVVGDPDRLQQVVWNLLSNAIKFTPRGGQVQVRLQGASSHVELVVSDTGQGIPPELLPLVFERFRQAATGPARSHGGLGLGLSLVRSLVELHGGSVCAESGGVQQGARFTVRLPVGRPEHLPALPAAPAAGPAGAPGPGALQGLRTLIVDDDRDALELFARVLAEHGADVVTASSAADALTRLEGARPDVLLSDIEMPEEDGLMLIRRVRALSAARGGAVPAVAVTAYGRAEDRVRALAAGFQLHIVKPVDPAELVAAVSAVTGRDRPSQPGQP